MKHIEDYTVRWHDTDAGREVRPTALLALMQETSNLQFYRVGRSLDALRDTDGVGFILSRIAVDILAPLHAYDDIRVETFTCQGHGLTFPRGFRVYRGEELVARCHSVWALMRIADRTLVRVEDAPLGFENEPMQETETPLRYRVPEALTFKPVGDRTIVWSDLDCNMHMNNTKYPDTVCDFLPNPENLRVVGMSFSYRREARFGDTVRVERADDGDGVFYFRTYRGEELCLEAMLRTVPRTGKETVC